MVLESPQMPDMPTRQELVDYVNAKAPNRRNPISMRTVRRWDAEGWIKRHPQSTHPVRYKGALALNFINGQF